MNLQEVELQESLVDNYNLDTAQKAVMVEDMDLTLELNRKQLYKRPEVSCEGVLFFPEDEKEGEEDVSRTIQIGNNYHEHIETKSSKWIPITAAAVVGTGLIAAALLWPKEPAWDEPVETQPIDTNTISAVRIIE